MLNFQYREVDKKVDDRVTLSKSFFTSFLVSCLEFRSRKVRILLAIDVASRGLFTSCFFSCLEFRSGKAPILLATDVASRGLGK